MVYAQTNATDAAALTTLLAAPLTATRRLNGSGVSTTKAPISMAGRAFASSSARISRISAAMSARSMHVSGMGVHLGAGGHSRQRESRSSCTVASAVSLFSSSKVTCSSQKNALRPLRAIKTTAPITAPAPTLPTASESRSAATHSHCEGISASNVQRGGGVAVLSLVAKDMNAV